MYIYVYIALYIYTHICIYTYVYNLLVALDFSRAFDTIDFKIMCKIKRTTYS